MVFVDGMGNSQFLGEFAIEPFLEAKGLVKNEALIDTIYKEVLLFGELSLSSDGTKSIPDLLSGCLLYTSRCV